MRVEETRGKRRRRDETRRDETRRDETRRDETRRDETRRDETRRDETRKGLDTCQGQYRTLIYPSSETFAATYSNSTPAHHENREKDINGKMGSHISSRHSGGRLHSRMIRWKLVVTVIFVQQVFTFQVCPHRPAMLRGRFALRRTITQFSSKPIGRFASSKTGNTNLQIGKRGEEEEWERWKTKFAGKFVIQSGTATTISKRSAEETMQNVELESLEEEMRLSQIVQVEQGRTLTVEEVESLQLRSKFEDLSCHTEAEGMGMRLASKVRREVFHARAYRWRRRRKAEKEGGGGENVKTEQDGVAPRQRGKKRRRMKQTRLWGHGEGGEGRSVEADDWTRVTLLYRFARKLLSSSSSSLMTFTVSERRRVGHCSRSAVVRQGSGRSARLCGEHSWRRRRENLHPKVDQELETPTVLFPPPSFLSTFQSSFFSYHIYSHCISLSSPSIVPEG
eukprot:767989-Hanusia_phi.AAC.6